MKPITDEDVAALAIDHERAQLLDAIVATTVVDPVRSAGKVAGRRGRRTSVLVGAVAASVAAVVAVPVWLAASGDDARPSPGPAPASSPSDPGDDRAQRDEVTGTYPVLAGAPDGWQFAGAGTEPLVSVALEREVPGGLMTFMVEIRPAADRDREVREQRTQGGLAAGTVDVHGRTADVWRLTEKAGAGGSGHPRGSVRERAVPCSEDCVTHWSAITPAEGGHYVLVIGAGLGPGTMTEAEWRALVAGVRLEDRASFEDWLPADVVLPADEQHAITTALAGVPVPPGFDPEEVELADYATSGAAALTIALDVACAWVELAESGAQADRAEARAELERVAQWPIHAELGRVDRGLLEMVATQSSGGHSGCG